MYSEADGMVIDAGRHTENLKMDDDGNVIEELIEEGLNEALHDQMLAACEEQREADEEIEDIEEER
jgi:hypothetical protein